MKLKMILFVAAFISLLAGSCSKKERHELAKKLPNTVVLVWNENAYLAFGGTAYQHSLQASRINAMMHIAMHDAVNAVYPVYASYKFTGKDAAADPVAAAASAAHTVLVNVLPESKNFLDSCLAESLMDVKNGEKKNRGIELGKQAAQAILQDRANDGSDQNPIVQIPVSNVPGVYQVVPPFDFQFAPFWENVKLFSLQSKSQFRPAPGPGINTPEYTEAFNEVKEYGALNSTVRTKNQTDYAKFWYEFSEAGWNRIARVVTHKQELNLFEAARLFALVDMAMADAYTAGWDAKNYYNFWRPYTAIRGAANDGNDNTVADAAWEPLMPTPPVQDYPSTHSALGNAAATVLAKLLGDNTSFVFNSPTAFPAFTARGYTSFSKAAKENADSRVRAGIHFRFACNAGLDLGGKIGKWTVDNYLRKL
jgi:methionine-rich copper-binding protein CopC